MTRQAEGKGLSVRCSRRSCGVGALLAAVMFASGCGDGGGAPPPGFTSISVRHDPAGACKTLIITFTAAEELSGEPTVTVNGNPATFVFSSDLDYIYSYVVQETETEGAVTVVIAGEDLEGNTLSAIGRATLDLTAPVVAVDPLVTNDTRPALTGTVDDAAACVWVWVHNLAVVATNNGNGTWAVADDTFGPLAEGTYDVRVDAGDPAGNCACDATADELVIDLTRPSGTVLTIGDPTSTSVSVTWTAATDDVTVQARLGYRGYYSLTDFADTSDATLGFTSTGGATNGAFTGLSPETAYWLAVVAVDEATNEESLSADNKNEAATTSTLGQLAWANRAGGTGEARGPAVAVLPDDSVVVTGSFEGVVTFGEGEANETTLSAAGGADIFIARYYP